jgi:cell wall-associated NlpC family hydrolase
MKKPSLIIALTLILTITTASPANANNSFQKVLLQKPLLINFVLEYKKKQSFNKIQNALIAAEKNRKFKINKRINQLSSHVDKTWYVFSGSTPDGWDCSGLVKWFYSDFDVQLEHSATAQKHSGVITTDPQPGDIIGFSHPNSKKVYHNGIYIGDGLFIHSPRVGAKTKISSVLKYAGEHSIVSFTRVNF